MFATHAQFVLAKISGFRFGLSQSLRFLPLKDRGLWFEIVELIVRAVRGKPGNENGILTKVLLVKIILKFCISHLRLSIAVFGYIVEVRVKNFNFCIFREFLPSEYALVAPLLL